MGSSIFSAATSGIVETFGVVQEVATLGTSLFVLGYAFGPILWAPMSELYGRRLPLTIGAFGFSIFSIAVATAKDFQTVMLGRFFGGLFGSCPLAVVAAAFADMFDNKTRGLAIAVFSATVFMGPLMAPFVSFSLPLFPGWPPSLSHPAPKDTRLSLIILDVLRPTILGMVADFSSDRLVASYRYPI